MKKKFRWLLVLIWMTVIFIFSAQNGESSSDLSGGISEWLLTNVLTFVNPEQFETNLRVLAHYSVFLVLGGLIIFAFDIYNRKYFIYSFLIGISYAVVDEIHQYFIPGRASELFDVMVDSLGVLTGIIIVYFIQFIIKKQIKK